MKLLFAALISSAGLLATAACESTTRYDGVSRFAGSDVYAPYYDLGSLPRDASNPGRAG